MTTFQSVNVSLGPRDSGEATTPTTPRAPIDRIARQPPLPIREGPEATTPTRDSFAAANGKRALPISPLSSSFPEPPWASRNERRDEPGNTDSPHASNRASQDFDMARSDDGEDGSDAESVDDESGRPSKKKKKGQRFFCTDYPPCKLSFTRSEHLARHIRKHTGERPFQCHCARRFSRLDNLRQHAQTVHVNEEIPGDSLAATGTRFQRQIRTDRVRPPGRSRAGSGAGSHGRGHARNLSTSSIASNASTLSSMSTMSTLSHDTNQRRPHSLTLGHPPSQRAGLSIDTMRASTQGPFSFGNQSPAEAGTPTSTNYNTPSSPFSSTLGSPVSISRHPGPWGERPPSRRLSVPSGTNPFTNAHPSMPAPFAHNPLNPSNSSLTSSNSSLVTSPTSSVYSFGKDPASCAEEWRRRTWHAYNSYNYPRPATSGLTFSQTPDAPRPAFAPQAVAAAGQSQQRLPGFETFDQISQRPETPTRSGIAESQPPVTPQRPGLYSTPSDRSVPGPNDRRGHASWDLSLHQNLTKLDITASGTPPKDSFMWPRSDAQPPQAPSSQPHVLPPPPSLPPGHVPAGAAPSEQPLDRVVEAEPTPHVQPPTPSRAKRSGWYNGPLQPASAAAPGQATTTQRRSPEDSSSSDGVPTPSSTNMDYQPGIVHSNGYVEAQPPAPKPVTNFSHPFHAQHAYSQSQPANRVIQAPRKPDLRGLEALVAAAESEAKAPSPIQQR